MSDVNGNTLPEILVVEHEGEPRARDVDIGESLGLKRPRVIRELIERNRTEMEAFGPLAVRHGKSRGQEFDEYLLTEEQALCVAAISSAPNAPTVRAMLIRTFVAWRRGHLLPTPHVDMNAIGGMVKGILSRQLHEIVPSLVAAEIATHNIAIRRGKTAGQIWKEHGFPPIRLGGWFSSRLVEMKCEIDGAGRGELGLSTARLFCPDKAAAWIRNGGRLMIERKLTERQGQGRLRLVSAA